MPALCSRDTLASVASRPSQPQRTSRRKNGCALNCVCVCVWSEHGVLAGWSHSRETSSVLWESSKLVVMSRGSGELWLFPEIAGSQSVVKARHEEVSGLSTAFSGSTSLASLARPSIYLARVFVVCGSNASVLELTPTYLPTSCQSQSIYRSAVRSDGSLAAALRNDFHAAAPDPNGSVTAGDRSGTLVWCYLVTRLASPCVTDVSSNSSRELLGIIAWHSGEFGCMQLRSSKSSSSLDSTLSLNARLR
ncbi:hypothetical protein F4780DRAFT_753028 [Xylariomycetidae sp. FL0641]|nr:hypothetical protein F4780DRAFT_753028 [Xylariomycetidae sp. FL0641]